MEGWVGEWEVWVSLRVVGRDGGLDLIWPLLLGGRMEVSNLFVYNRVVSRL